MAFPQNRFLIIVCEGESEVAYIQELNRLFRELEISATLQPVCVGTGFFSNVVAAYRNARRDNPRTDIQIWVDWDIYARNERQCMDAYSRKGGGIPSFCFSRQNFEDFLVTHLAEDELARWLEVCRSSGHLKEPLHSEQYIPLFRETLFPQYSKGDIPFPLTHECIERMLQNQDKDDMPLHCDFANTIRGPASKVVASTSLG